MQQAKLALLSGSFHVWVCQAPAATARHEKLGSQNIVQPGLPTVSRPSATRDQGAIELGRSQRPDDVGCRVDVQIRAQRNAVSQRLRELTHVVPAAEAGSPPFAKVVDHSMELTTNLAPNGNHSATSSQFPNVAPLLST